MREAFLSGGVLMWPLLVIGVGVVVLTAQTAWLLARSGRAAAEADQRLHAILFWGVMSVILGLLGTTVGLTQMAQAITLAGGVERAVAWGGFAVALVTLIFGLLIFLVAAVLWFILRQWALHLAAWERRNLPAT